MGEGEEGACEEPRCGAHVDANKLSLLNAHALCSASLVSTTGGTLDLQLLATRAQSASVTKSRWRCINEGGEGELRARLPEVTPRRPSSTRHADSAVEALQSEVAAIKARACCYGMLLSTVCSEFELTQREVAAALSR